MEPMRAEWFERPAGMPEKMIGLFGQNTTPTPSTVTMVAKLGRRASRFLQMGPEKRPSWNWPMEACITTRVDIGLLTVKIHFVDGLPQVRMAGSLGRDWPFVKRCLTALKTPITDVWADSFGCPSRAKIFSFTATAIVQVGDE